MPVKRRQSNTGRKRRRKSYCKRRRRSCTPRRKSFKHHCKYYKTKKGVKGCRKSARKTTKMYNGHIVYKGANGGKFIKVKGTKRYLKSMKKKR